MFVFQSLLMVPIETLNLESYMCHRYTDLLSVIWIPIFI